MSAQCPTGLRVEVVPHEPQSRLRSTVAAEEPPSPAAAHDGGADDRAVAPVLLLLRRTAGVVGDADLGAHALLVEGVRRGLWATQAATHHG